MQQLNSLETQQVSGGSATAAISFITSYIMGSKNADPFVTIAFATTLGLICYLPMLGMIGTATNTTRQLFLVVNFSSNALAAIGGYGLSQWAGLEGSTAQ